MSESERLRGIYAASMLSKVITLFNRGLLLPLVAAKLVPADYAIYTLLLSAVAFLSSFDVGIGGGTLNKVSGAFARGDKQGIRSILFKAYALTLSLCGIFLLVGLCAHYSFDWLQVAGKAIDSISASRSSAILAFSGAIIVQCMFAISMKVLQGVARQMWANLLGGLVNGGYAFAIVLFMTGSSTGLTGLVHWTLGLSAVAQVAGILLTIHEVARLGRGGDPRLQVENTTDAPLLSEAWPFGVIAIAVFAERESLKWVLGTVGNLTAVSRFSIYSQVLVAGIGIVQMLLMPFWPLLLNSTAAQVRHQVILRRAMRIAGLVAALMVLTGMLSAGFGFYLSSRIWGEAYGWTRMEWCAFGLYVSCSAPKHVLFPILVGLGGVRRAAVSYALEMGVLIGVLLLMSKSLRLDHLMFCLAGISAFVSCPLFYFGVRTQTMATLSRS